MKKDELICYRQGRKGRVVKKTKTVAAKLAEWALGQESLTTGPSICNQAILYVMLPTYTITSTTQESSRL